MEFDFIRITEQLCKINAVSGMENGNKDKLKQLLLPFFDEFKELSYNNYLFIKHGKKGGKKILLDAHFDQIGMIVTGIEKNGCLRVLNMGGVDIRNLISTPVTIHGSCCDAGGLVTYAKKEISPLKSENMLIWTDMSEQELKECGIGIGSAVSLDGEMLALKDNKISCRSLDDRICAVSIAHAASALSSDDFCGDLYFLFSSQEETQGVGAKTGSFNLMPDIAIAVDVDFASTPETDKKDTAQMGKGPTIAISTHCDRKLTKRIIALAEKNNISIQPMLCPKSTGTNSGHISVAGEGVPVAVIGIPIRNMHTTYETVDIDDVKQTGMLLAEIIKSESEDV